MCWYPEYLEKHFNTQYLLMKENGPLPIDWRYFLAIMVIILIYFFIFLYLKLFDKKLIY